MFGHRLLPEQKVEAAAKKKLKKPSKLSRFFNLCFEVFLGFHVVLLFSGFVLLPVSFVCIAILAIPQFWSNAIAAYNSILASIGWLGLFGAVLIPAGIFLTLRTLWLWKSVRNRNRKISFEHARCFAGFHDYKVVDGFEEHVGPLINNTCVSKCSRCSSERSETYDDKSNFY